jgi:sec-independent protein translocase protein TatC
MNENQNEQAESASMNFMAHLLELRNRLIICILALAIGMVVLCIFPGPSTLFDIWASPLSTSLPKGASLIATSVISPFMVPLKVTLWTALLLVSPVVFWQIWGFIAPGLYVHEKRLVLPLVVASTFLFATGIAFCHFFVFKQLFSFIQTFAPKSISATPDVEAYLDFVLSMFLAFGLSFEVPIAVILLAKLGVVTVEQLKGFRRYFIVVAFVVAAVVTPPDVVSQLALAIPMCFLYELGIHAASFFMEYTKADSGTETDSAAVHPI